MEAQEIEGFVGHFLPGEKGHENTTWQNKDEEGQSWRDNGAVVPVDPYNHQAKQQLRRPDLKRLN